MKRILGLLLVLSMTLSLVACASPDTELYNALEKMQGVTSLETETEMSFNIKGEGFEESEQMLIDQLGANLNNLTLSVKQKAIGNEEQTEAQAEGTVNVKIGGMAIDLNLWTDVDLDSGKMKTIIQLPAMLKGFMGPELVGKEYLVYDIEDLMELEDEEVDFGEVMELQKELQPKIIKLAEEIQKDFKPDFKIIDLKEEKEVDGEKVNVYELKLDDITFKELVKEFVNTTLENEGTREFIVDYLNSVIDMVPEEEISEEEMEELEDLEEDLEENMEKVKEEFNKFMEKVEDVQILGEEGIVIEYSVGKNGYVVETNGVMDFRLDLEEVAKAMGEDEGAKGILNFKINYNTKNKNINNKDMEVEFPETTEENSINFKQMIEKQMEELEKQMELIEEMEEQLSPEEMEELERQLEGLDIDAIEEIDVEAIELP